LTELATVGLAGVFFFFFFLAWGAEVEVVAAKTMPVRNATARNKGRRATSRIFISSLWTLPELDRKNHGKL
jgi:hypothetical protein